MNRTTLGIGAGLLLALGVVGFLMWPGTTPPDDTESAETPIPPKPKRKVTVFDPSNVGDNPDPDPTPVTPTGPPAYPGDPPPMAPKSVAPVEGLTAELATEVETFLGGQLDPTLPPRPTREERVSAYRKEFTRTTREWAGIEEELKTQENSGTPEERRSARIARARVRAGLADYVRQLPAPAHLPDPQAITYGKKRNERADLILDEALELLDELVESDPAAAQEADALREELTRP